MKIGIISAMREEIQTLLNHLENKKSFKKGMRTYFSGQLYDKEVVLAFSRWGKVASATTTTQMLNDFELSEIVFTGVAGSVKDNIHIGDIVIGKNMFQYDMDASPLIDPLEIPLLDKKYFETDASKRTILARASSNFLMNYSDFIDEMEARNFNIMDPKILIEDIGSGDQFISTREQIKTIKKRVPSVGCIEMEGASVAQVCYEYKIPFNIIRTISDQADDNAAIEFQKFAEEIASKYALGIIKNYFALQ